MAYYCPTDMAEQSGVSESNESSPAARSGSTAGVTQDGDSTVGKQAARGALQGFQLPTALHTIAFSTAIAVLTGISACVGMSFASGRKEALGLYALTSDPIDQRHVFVGLTLIGQVLVDSLVIGIIARLAYLSIGWLTRKTQRRIAIPAFIKQHIWLLALLVATVDAGFLMNVMVRLSNHVEGILFKNLAEVGRFWQAALFETDYHSTAGGYSLVYSGLLALFVSLCWWLIARGPNTTLTKAIVTIMGLFVVLVSLLDFGYLMGAVNAVSEYPIVVISSQSGVIGGTNDIPILLGADDKMFAFLDVRYNAKPDDEVHKMIVYLPRSEVRYMIALKTVPLYTFDKYDDLQRLEQDLNTGKQASPAKP